MSIKNFYKDGSFKTISFELKNFPGVVAQTNKEPQLSYYHKFEIELPREYPQNLSEIRIVNRTPLYHPRIAEVGTKACYAVNGELDRILVDIIYNVLMRPETIRSPNEYKDADWGLDTNKMKWYIVYGPTKLYEYLIDCWKTRITPKVQILGDTFNE